MPTLRPRKSTQDEDSPKRQTRKKRSTATARRSTRRTLVSSEVSTESEEDDNLLAQMAEELSSPQKKNKRTPGRQQVGNKAKKIKIGEKNKTDMELVEVEKEEEAIKAQVEKDIYNILNDIGNLRTSGSGKEKEELSLTVSSSTAQKKDSEKVEILNAGGERLHRNFHETRRLGEEFAVEFLSNTTNHPVISCFRELKGTDISQLIDTQKMKKQMGAVHLSVVYMGLIDYMAVTIDNPFYVDESSFKKPIKNIPAKVTKIMNDFKSTLTSWGVSDYPAWKERYSTTMSFLKAQVCRFKGIQFDETFEGLLTSIEAEVTRNKQKYDFMTSSTRKVIEVEDPVVITFEKQSEASKICSSQTKNPLNKSSEMNLLSPSSDCVEFTSGPSKKLRLDSLDSPEERENKISDVSISVTVKKPKVNAFALLMNRSKEIAEQKKQQKLLGTPPPRMISH